MAHRTAPSPLNPNAAALQQSASSDGYDPKGKKPSTTDSDFLALDMGSSASNPSGAAGSGDQYLQMQLMDNQQNNYMQQRSTAIESIESTISELGQIFSQLAHMVAEQRETVQRIDDNVMEVVDNVGGAQRELLKYYASVSSNRWLMLKIFGVLIVFFLRKYSPPWSRVQDRNDGEIHRDVADTHSLLLHFCVRIDSFHPRLIDHPPFCNHNRIFHVFISAIFTPIFASSKLSKCEFHPGYTIQPCSYLMLQLSIAIPPFGRHPFQPQHFKHIPLVFGHNDTFLG